MTKSLRKLILYTWIIFLCPFFSYAQKNGASDFLYEYGVRLYREGNLYDAIHQLKNALLVNPRHTHAKDFLNKIFSELQNEHQETFLKINQEKIEKITTRIRELEMEKQECQRQLASFKNLPQEKERELEKTKAELEIKKKQLEEERSNLVRISKEQEQKIQELKNQIAKLQEQEHQYQEQLRLLRQSESEKKQELIALKQELDLKDKRSFLLLQEKEKALEKIKDFYENKIQAINQALEEKKLETEQLDLKTKEILQQARQKELAKLARIDHIMRQIEELLPEVKYPFSQSLEVGKKQRHSRQLARINAIMRKIEEVLPKLE